MSFRACVLFALSWYGYSRCTPNIPFIKYCLFFLFLSSIYYVRNAIHTLYIYAYCSAFHYTRLCVCVHVVVFVPYIFTLFRCDRFAWRSRSSLVWLTHTHTLCVYVTRTYSFTYFNYSPSHNFQPVIIFNSSVIVVNPTLCVTLALCDSHLYI